MGWGKVDGFGCDSHSWFYMRTGPLLPCGQCLTTPGLYQDEFGQVRQTCGMG